MHEEPDSSLCMKCSGMVNTKNVSFSWNLQSFRSRDLHLIPGITHVHTGRHTHIDSSKMTNQFLFLINAVQKFEPLGTFICPAHCTCITLCVIYQLKTSSLPSSPFYLFLWIFEIYSCKTSFPFSILSSMVHGSELKPLLRVCCAW